MPLVVRAVQASMEQLDPALNEAAGSLGAKWWQRFLRITLPLVLPGAVAGTLLAFVIALGEYVASILVFVPIIGQSRLLSLQRCAISILVPRPLME